MPTATKKERKPVVDESEAATVAPVTTSTVKHAVEADTTVQDDELNEKDGNVGDPIHDPAVNKKLEGLFAEAPPLINVELVKDAEIEAPEKDDVPAEELTEEQTQMLKDCEKKITKGLSSFVEVGNALSIILINRLYKQQFKTWEAYLDHRWGFTRQRAFQYIQAAEGHQKLSTQIAGDRRLPDSERAMRELLKAPKDKLLDILDKLEGEDDLTAERVMEVRKEVAPNKASAKAKKKPVIKTKRALKAASVWTEYLASCDIKLLTADELQSLRAAHQAASKKYTNLNIAA